MRNIALNTYKKVVQRLKSYITPNRRIVIALALTLFIAISSMQPVVSNNIIATHQSNARTSFTSFILEEPRESYTESLDKPMGGCLRIAISYFMPPPKLNPHIDYFSAVPILYPIWNCFFRHDENGSLIPDLAYGYDLSENGTQLIVYFYNNISWHDGHLFDAYDAEFSLKKMMENHTTENPVHINWRNYVSCIESVEAINTTALLVNLKYLFSPIIEYFTFIPISLAEHIFDGQNMTANPWGIYDHPVGTGPFKYGSWTPGINLTLTTNEQYFRGRPPLDSLLYRYDIPIENLADALANNEVDLVPENIDPARIVELQQIPGITVTITDAMKIRYAGFNFSNPYLSDPIVRTAIDYGINKVRIVEKSLLGYATVATGPIPPARERWYNSEVTIHQHNSTYAEELLDSKYPRDKTGWRFNLSIKAPISDYDPWLYNASFLVQEDLKAIGINASLEHFDVPDILGAVPHDILILTWDLTAVHDPDAIYELFHTEGWLNWWGYSNAELDKYLEWGRGNYTYTVRQVIYNRVQEILATDLPNIFLYHPKRINDHNNDFHGLISNPSIVSINSYILEDVWYEPTVSGEGNCPFYLGITHKGNVTGYEYYIKEALEQIPNSTYSGVDSDPQLVKLRSPEPGFYSIQIIGKEWGYYEVELVSISLEYKHVLKISGYIAKDCMDVYHFRVNEDGTITLYEAWMEIWKIYSHPEAMIHVPVRKSYVILS